ncbi:MAG: aldose 1-epimerase family protein [Salinibacterium sp.]|nr:aldose 1-epimerase family protein [Salinibacterium sp.]
MSSAFGMPIADALERVGSLEQLARVDSLVEADGPARGARLLRVVNGGGLEFDVHPDRGLDIGAASFQGLPLAWLSSTGIAAPSHYEPVGRGWLRTFGGGLVTTCGLDSFGPPADDEDGIVGMHGRVGHIPARLTTVEATPERILIAGTVRQTAVFAENLALRREISTEVGSSTLTITDIVTNEGATASPLMVLYHVNLGWPLLDDGTTLDIPSASVTARDADAESGFDNKYDIGSPVAGFREQVYIHESSDDRYARVSTPSRGIELTLRYSETLPALFEWKMTATHHYVLGLEPANTPEINGRAGARAAGRLPYLQPGETITYSVSIEVGRI